MSDAAIQESRRRLRRVQKHLSQAQVNLGTKQEQVGLVEVIHHPSNQHPLLNYVTPRKNTAWIPTPEVKKGLDRLRELERIPRVIYIEGLYPPLFAKSIRGLGLVVEQEAAILTYKPEESGLQKVKPVELPEGFRYEEVTTQADSALWWYVWRNAGEDALTKGIEPLHIGGGVHDLTRGNQADILLFKGGRPVGVARLTLHEHTAHIAALAVMKESRTPEVIQVMYRTALRTALKRQCTLVFTSEAKETDHQVCRDLGFVDSGSTVCYVEATDEKEEEPADEKVAQSVFVLRERKESPSEAPATEPKPDTRPQEAEPGESGQ